MVEGFTCSTCNEYHEGVPFDYGFKFPEYYFEIPSEERDERIQVNDDLCVVDDEFFFIRGCIEIPIIGEDKYFVWGVWCSLSEKSFERVQELWDVEEVENEPPFFGWLNSSLPSEIYPETLNLKTNVYLKNNNQRPFIDIEPTEHPLAVDQVNGITIERIKEIAETLIHQ